MKRSGLKEYNMAQRLMLLAVGFFIILTIHLYHGACMSKESQATSHTSKTQQLKHLRLSSPITKDFFGAEFMASLKGLKKREKLHPTNNIVQLIEELAPILQQLGVGVIGFAVTWSEVEQRPPVNNTHNYDWSFLDSIMKILHKNKLSAKIQVFPQSKWASVQPREARAPVKKEYLRYWYDFVQALVERYDADGKSDAFSMQFPLLKMLVVSGEVEALSHWAELGGTPADYDSLLTNTTRRVKEASDSVLVARPGTNFGPHFDSVAEGVDIRTLLGERHKKGLDFLEASIREEDEYDLYGIQLNSSWRATTPTVSFMRQKLNKYGYHKPLYCNHARSTDTEMTGSFLTKLLDSQGPQHEATLKQMYSTQASVTVKKLVLGMTNDLTYMGVCTIFDFLVPLDLLEPEDRRKLRKIHKNIRNLSWSFCGLFDSKAFKKTKDAGAWMKPALRSYGLVIDKLGGTSQTAEILGLGKSVYAYKFTNRGRPIYVFWYDNSSAGHQTNKVKKIRLPVSSKLFRITHIITEMDKTMPETEQVRSKGGELELVLTDKPIFVEELS
jgi:hypothetical protein